VSLFDRFRSKPQFPNRPSEELIKVIAQVERIITNWEITVDYSIHHIYPNSVSRSPYGYTLAGNTPDGIIVTLSYDYGGNDGYEYLTQGRLKGKEDGVCSVAVSVSSGKFSPYIYNKSFCGKKEYLFEDNLRGNNLDPASFAYVQDYIVRKVRRALQAEAAEKERQRKAAATKARIKKEEEERAWQRSAQEAKNKFWNR
jgi:hypothetical protein